MDNLDRIRQIIAFELDGISKTIKQYSTDDFIVSYTNQLQGKKYPQDDKSIIFLTKKIIKWYETTIDQIKEDKFIYNKTSHIKSYNLLQELNSLISHKKNQPI
ncbi:MAG: hypothetical protein KAU02_03240 [Tenericutes bacterium]|nr:hypothetical protein [Mycoplasmatota bacterium]